MSENTSNNIGQKIIYFKKNYKINLKDFQHYQICNKINNSICYKMDVYWIVHFYPLYSKCLEEYDEDYIHGYDLLEIKDAEDYYNEFENFHKQKYLKDFLLNKNMKYIRISMDFKKYKNIEKRIKKGPGLDIKRYLILNRLLKNNDIALIKYINSFLQEKYLILQHKSVKSKRWNKRKRIICCSY